MLFLQLHDIPTGQALKIFKRYGHHAIAVLRRNPYRLAGDIGGIGFKTADRMARRMNFPPASPLRVEAGVLYLLNESAGQGHVFFPWQGLAAQAVDLLGVAPELVREAIAHLAQKGRIVVEPPLREMADPQGGTAVYLPYLKRAEENVARLLARLMASPASVAAMAGEAALDLARKSASVDLVPRQLAAVREAVNAKVMVITGGPGTGKTTIIRAILQVFDEQRAAVHLAAPTGRAAKRIAETTGRKASTIHRLLEYSIQKGGFQRDEASVDDIQVLTPMHRGAAGVDELNHVLQAALNPGGAELVRGSRIYRVNDKVMQIRNNYDKDVFNGDIGRITALQQGSQGLEVSYDGRRVSYAATELDEIMTAYAVSVHKSQGSEFPAVVIPVLPQHYILLQRNLIYTAITRGRRLVVLVGTRRALAMAVGRSDQQIRHTGLQRRLTAIHV